MTTLATMKARIADEIMRDDLTSRIATAISDAIKFYQPKRFFFNETDAITFPTVAAQAVYTSADNSLIPNLYDIDAIWILDSGGNFDRLSMTSPEGYRDLISSTATGEPYKWAYFLNELRFYPTPNAVQTVRIQAHYKLAEPANDTEANNAWMNEAEELIRFRARGLLFRDVIYDAEKAVTSFSAELEARKALDDATNKLANSQTIEPMAF